MVLPQLGQAEESNTWDYNTILNQLAQVYDNPNKVQEAEDRLLSLRQGTDSVPLYISKFERVLYKARGQDWPDINKSLCFGTVLILLSGVGSINSLTYQLDTQNSYRSSSSFQAGRLLLLRLLHLPQLWCILASPVVRNLWISTQFHSTQLILFLQLHVPVLYPQLEESNIERKAGAYDVAPLTIG
jgi:hypothetical protein